MNWQLLLIVFFICTTVGNLQRRTFSKTTKHDAAITSLLVHGMAILPLGIIWAFFQHTKLLVFTPSFIIFALLASVCGALFSILAYKSQKTVDAGQFAIIGNLSTPVVVLLSALFLHESLNFAQMFATLLIIAGTCIVTYQRSHIRVSNRKHILLAVLASLLSGLTIVFERYAMKITSMAAFFVIGWSIQAIVLAILSRKKLHHIRQITRYDFSVMFRMGAVRFGSFMFFLLAVNKSSNISLVTAASSFRVVSICIAAYIFLDEKDMLVHKTIGAVLATAGLLLM